MDDTLLFPPSDNAEIFRVALEYAYATSPGAPAAAGMIPNPAKKSRTHKITETAE
ncbi:hypothetical protein [Methanogenium cariaci]|uniref:hypothetical protein n=1 Tax=Methanogenium cariaci TaxID=2197 RepID=UPI0012F63837|nr:hypothetical protein [Methanogenium cariaci]